MKEMILQEKRDFLLALLAGTISGITAVALFAQSGYLISKAALLPPFYIILILTAFLKLFGVAKSVSKYAERYISHRVTFSLLEKIRLRFFKTMEPHAQTLLSIYRSGDLLTRMTKDVETLQEYFLRVVYPPLVALLVFFFTMLFTVWFSVWVTLLLLLSVVLAIYVLPLLWKKTEDSTVERQYAEELTEYFYGLTDLTVVGKVTEEKQKLFAMNTRLAQEREKIAMQTMKAQLTNQAIALLTALLVTIMGAYFVANGALDGLYLAMLLLISLTVFEVAVPLGTVPMHKAQTSRAYERLTALPTVIQQNGQLPPQPFHTLEVRDISYQYPHSEFKALENISLHITAGEKIAIVGPSGAGKSTLFQLLIHNIRQTAGEILWNGLSTRSIQETHIWEKMGIMLQHNHFFSGTVYENLLTDQCKEEVDTLLLALELPLRSDDIILERAKNLSGGEQQRLALARVLLRDVPLYLLDEPFAHLNDELTAKCTKMLLQVPQTVLCITHKLTNIEQFDRLFVINDNQLVEAGSYAELMEKRGYFYNMQNTC